MDSKIINIVLNGLGAMEMFREKDSDGVYSIYQIYNASVQWKRITKADVRPLTSTLVEEALRALEAEGKVREVPQPAWAIERGDCELEIYYTMENPKKL